MYVPGCLHGVLQIRHGNKLNNNDNNNTEYSKVNYTVFLVIASCTLSKKDRSTHTEILANASFLDIYETMLHAVFEQQQEHTLYQEQS